MKIVSGGQAGADRAALDAALEKGLRIGGYVPQGRWAEDGPIDARYTGLVELDSAEPADRTRCNVETTDGTLIFSHGKLSGGSLLTWQIARNARKPCLHMDLLANADSATIEKILLWLRTQDIEILNVAGPRASKDPEIYDAVYRVLTQAFEKLSETPP